MAASWETYFIGAQQISREMRKKISPFSRLYLIISKVEGVNSKVDAYGIFSGAASSCDQSIMYSNYLNLNSYMCDYWKNGIAVFVKFATIKLSGSKPREK